MAATAFFYAAKRSALHSRRIALAWQFFAWSELILTLGNLNECIGQFGIHTPTWLSYLFYFCFYPPILLGVTLLPAKRLTWLALSKTVLDITIILLSVTLAFWSYWLGPLVVAEGGKSLNAQLIVLTSPIGDFILLGALILLLYRQPNGPIPKSLYFLSFGACISIIPDLNFGYQLVRGKSLTGSTLDQWLDLGWAMASLSFGLAGVWQATSSSFMTRSGLNGDTIGPPPAKLNTWLAYLPYGWALAVYLMLAQIPTHTPYMDTTWLTLAVGLIIGLVFIRQMVTLRENNLLFAQVHHQASALRSEVQERKKAEAQLAHDALHDALTGLPNRVLFADRLRHAIELKMRQGEYNFAVLFLDLDQFKVVNDSLGHATGDQLLIALTQRLRLCLRTGDTVARLGGDEFVLLLEDTKDAEDATATANRILVMLRQPFNLIEHQIFVTASIGIVIDAANYDSPTDILRDADIAMYQAKIQGKARSEVFSMRMREQAHTRLTLENDLRTVLERHELELYYQPILALRSDFIIGFEALLRWHHPQRGLIAPAEFIPIAEETGLIIPIGQWVLSEACHQLRTWQHQFPQLPRLTMSVNISGVQFKAPGFIEQVAATLEAAQLDPTMLRLELTESVWLNSTPAAIALFQRLSAMGIQLHIDDFGTGYSSLAYLQNFPIRTLKIDRMFLSKMDQDSNNRDMMRSVIIMAHDLGLETVAEGIETVEQLDRLKQFGCNYGQGYLLSRPIDRQAVEKLLTQLSAKNTAALSARQPALFLAH